ncbi:hypothetical protein [uncultured Corynebacterium sp.]|uniref:hypothetical protein n=1 Tax=uncultured Corynebacterium sp. TaxID=159447 RepID=UPI0025DEEAD8|nr:hypothetical protein [uncultured Corynebacterium sp.]
MNELENAGGAVAQVVFRHDPTSSPQWSYYGINAPLTGTAAKLSEAKFAATQDLQFLSGEAAPEMRSYAEWVVAQDTEPEAMLAPGVPMFVRALQDEDTNHRLHRQNLAQAYLEGIRATPEIRASLPGLVGDDTADGAEGPAAVILVTLFPDDLLGDALLNLTAQDTVVFCLPDGDSLSFLPVRGDEVWPADGPGMLEQLGLDEFATVQDLMSVSDDGE